MTRKATPDHGSWVHRLPKNEKGRDFAIWGVDGDLGGLRVQLGSLGFMSDRDRLFSLGDGVGNSIVHAGTVLTSGIFTVMLAGRAERDLLKTLTDDGAYRQGDVGCMELAFPRGPFLSATEDRLQALPVALEVAGRDGVVFGFLPARVPMGASWQQLTEFLEDRHVTVAATCSYGEVIDELGPENVEGVGRFYCGGALSGQPGNYGNVTILPRGVVILLDDLARGRSDATGGAKAATVSVSGNVIQVEFRRRR